MLKCLVPTFSDGKKGAHTATPHPAKKSVKKTAETPKSSAQLSCDSCNKLVHYLQPLFALVLVSLFFGAET